MDSKLDFEPIGSIVDAVDIALIAAKHSPEADIARERGWRIYGPDLAPHIPNTYIMRLDALMPDRRRMNVSEAIYDRMMTRETPKSLAHLIRMKIQFMIDTMEEAVVLADTVRLTPFEV